MFTRRIWDLPTRLFHWSLAAGVIGLLITGQVGGGAMVWHFRLGFAVLSLLLFRLAWGFYGGYWSRWSNLPLHPRHVIHYLRHQDTCAGQAGHNPLGAWAIVAMLSMLFLQVSTGLISDDEIANAGPLTAWVSGTWVSWATHWHKNWGKWFILVLVLMHGLALLWHHFRRHPPLLPAMLHGDKTLPEPVQASRDHAPQRLVALLIWGVSALVVYSLLAWAG